MEKTASSSPSSPSSWMSEGGGGREVQCVGRLEIVRHKPVGFLCGSIPVPTDKSFHSFNSKSSAAILPSPPPSPSHTVSAPRYRMLPAETDLNRLPVVSNFPDKVLPIAAVVQSSSKSTTPAGAELSWDGDAVSSNLTRKCEALAVSGLAEYGDEIDVIASTDILKQIFKMPYSKARLSIAVRRIGQTLVLNTGPDLEEGEKLVRRHKTQSKCADQSLFLNFAMHSVRMEACDCPPIHHSSSEGQVSSSALAGTDCVRQTDGAAVNGGYNHFSEYSQMQKDGFIWECNKNKRSKDHHPVKKASHVGEKPRSAVQESEKHKRVSNDGFLRVLFWQFHNFRMLLGSDLLLFSNEKYVAVSLHLFDVTHQVTPLTWLDAWLDNVMASVPELAICYHRNGVVQGYELLKTDDIFLLKGISEEGTPAFHPHVVQQNGLSVLRFLQENCKQEPGAYWLYKSAGEDMIELFDLSVIPKSHPSSNAGDSSSSLPSFINGGKSDSLFSLGTLLYRIAHRLSLSMAANNMAKCARFFRKCLEFLDEPNHLVMRAFAHEQFARLLLTHDEGLELNLISESLPVECEVMVPVESLNSSCSVSESAVYENLSLAADDKLSEDGKVFDHVISEASLMMTLEANVSSPTKLITSSEIELQDSEGSMPGSTDGENFAVSKISPSIACVVQTVADPISSKLAAVHHVSQAIKSLRWMRQLHATEAELLDRENTNDKSPSSMDFSVCACGDADCIEVCDIREWLPTSKIDHKLWKLVLLLGESYLALGQAYMEDNQLQRTLKIVELACSIYGSMPQHLEETRFISSIIKNSSLTKCKDKNEKKISHVGDVKEVKSSSSDDSFAFERFSSTYIFWAKAWTLVADVYVEFYFIKGKELSTQSDSNPSAGELRMSSEVVKEVQRLKKKLGQYAQNCSSCSLVNCSCQSDRASSGSSASSSSGDKHSLLHGRKHGKRSSAKSSTHSLYGETDDGGIHHRVENRRISETEFLQLDTNGDTPIEASKTVVDELQVNSSAAAADNEIEEQGDFKMHEGFMVPRRSKTASKEIPKGKSGGIFEYLRDFLVGDAEQNLSTALSCYEKARKALAGLPTGSAELQSVTKKIGWVCNELGRNRLQIKELIKAELAFADAIVAFREVSDYPNVLLINCNLGHGRRALAEEMVSKLESFKLHAVFHSAYKQALQTAKLEYCEALRYYGAAKSELSAIKEEDISVSSSLKNEVYTQFAHTYLRFGMLLAREDTSAEVYENGALENMTAIHVSPSGKKERRELGKHEISANDAIREALSVYESLGELRKQEAAYAYFQLACYQRDCCLKFLDLDQKKSSLPKGENSMNQRVKQYVSLAERNWQKAIDFYGPKTHPTMYLTILTERSALLLSLSGAFRSNVMLESALLCMLEGRHISETVSDSFATDNPEVHGKFWGHLQTLLKKMLASTLPANTNRSSAAVQSTSASNRPDPGELRELYKMALKSNDFSQLHAMNTLWTS